ncbi:MAG TPA: Mur ligase family protein, partial [Candidatus Saccharimonadales bacterium]|nr:Mur ligase family protein [Candidatus Saccharimonadales bacterium]
MKIAILGYGEQGRSAYDYWKKPENEITICDKNTELKIPPFTNKQLGKNYLKNLSEFDLLVRSPSVAPEDIVKNNTPEILEKVTSVTNEFFKACPTKNIIGVTGTKGKGTTSSLIAEMLKAAKKHVHIGGNIGTPPLDLLKDGIGQDDYVVLELANFQLIDLKYSPPIAVCLMVAPEHLDWHPHEDHYYDSKKPLFKHQSEKDYVIYFAKNDLSKKIVSSGKGQKIPYYEKPGAVIENGNLVIGNKTICSTADFKLPGEHNWQNICAATTAFWQIEN